MGNRTTGTNISAERIREGLPGFCTRLHSTPPSEISVSALPYLAMGLEASTQPGQGLQYIL